MDVDDIIRDVSRDLDPFAAAGDGDEYASRSRGSSASAQADLQALTRAWINERGSPELLAWPADNLIERVSGRIKVQIEKVEEMTGDMDPKTNFGLIVVQTELERWKYLVRGFLRCRIAKIDAHTLHYLSAPSLLARLSQTEIAYATRHQQLLHSHYLSSFLSSFPAQLQNLNDTAGGISMIGGPDEESCVFVRAVCSQDNLEEDRNTFVVKGSGRDEDGEVEVRRGDVVAARWVDVRDHVERQEMELV